MEENYAIYPFIYLFSDRYLKEQAISIFYLSTLFPIVQIFCYITMNSISTRHVTTAFNIAFLGFTPMTI